MRVTHHELKQIIRCLTNLYNDGYITEETNNLMYSLIFRVKKMKTLPNNYQKALCYITCFWIAHKFYETEYIHIDSLRRCAFYKITKKQFIKAELEILKLINYKLF